MAGLAYRGARGAKSATAASSSGGFGDSYIRDNTRRYLCWWKGTRDLYFEATREIVHLQLLEVTQAALTAAEGEASTARALLSAADGRVAGTLLLFVHN